MLSDILPWLSSFLLICVTVAGILAYRQTASKAAAEIQERVISALKAETESLRSQVADHEKEISHLKQVIETVQSVLSRRGINLSIEGEVVVVTDKSGKVSGVRAKPRSSAPKKKEEQP